VSSVRIQKISADTVLVRLTDDDTDDEYALTLTRGEAQQLGLALIATACSPSTVLDDPIAKLDQ
jgi:ABC-type taurine transport system ATPase subunit